MVQSHKADINSKIDFTNMISATSTQSLGTSSGRRLTQSDITPGQTYTVSENGIVEPH